MLPRFLCPPPPPPPPRFGLLVCRMSSRALSLSCFAVESITSFTSDEGINFEKASDRLVARNFSWLSCKPYNQIYPSCGTEYSRSVTTAKDYQRSHGLWQMLCVSSDTGPVSISASTQVIPNSTLQASIARTLPLSSSMMEGRNGLDFSSQNTLDFEKGQFDDLFD